MIAGEISASKQQSLAVLESVRQWAEVAPLQTAVADTDAAITYQELVRAIDLYSEALREAGCGPGTPVYCWLDRSAHAVTAMLAVFAAECVYVPVVPEWPQERLRRMSGLCPPGAVLGVGSASDAIPSWLAKDVPVLTIGHDGTPSLLGGPRRAPASPADLSGMAYLIFTSGSTGTPKAVAVSRKNLDSLRAGLQDIVPPASAAGKLRIALLASFCFDASLQQVVVSLSGGHELRVVPDCARRDPQALERFLKDHAIELSDATPSHLRLLANCRPLDGRPLPVKRFIVGGEILRSVDVARFREKYGGDSPALTNIYGVAECAVDSLYHEVTADTVALPDLLPVGKPLRGVTAFLVDEDNRIVEDGAGELVLGGPGVGEGYYRDPQQTLQRFFTRSDGLRCYRTGDRARFSGGVYTILGRRDGQIKVRGHRIEPAEVEAALLDYRAAKPETTGLLAVINHMPLQRDMRSCRLCLLTGEYPGVTIGNDGVCSRCALYNHYKARLDGYFRTPPDFWRDTADLRRTKSRPDNYDCLLLFSGGKDSTYVLHQLVDAGWRVLAYTFNNGFLSPACLDNIRKVTGTLDVDIEFGSTRHIDRLLWESLTREQSVCSGCFRALTISSTQCAVDRGINLVVTGLSRGQLAQTKLLQFLGEESLPSQDLAGQLRTYWEAFHLKKDRAGELLESNLTREQVSTVASIDYFRYDPLSAADVRAYLSRNDPHWKQPGDTGLCSSNCTLNDVGIAIHRQTQGYHPYGEPLSWDIRLGLLSREEGLRQIGAAVEPGAAAATIRRLHDRATNGRAVREAIVLKRDDDWLVAFFSVDEAVDTKSLRRYLEERLPHYLIPDELVQVDKMPLNSSGKIDREALLQSSRSIQPAAQASSDVTGRLRSIWADLLGNAVESIDEDFFDVGGTSLKATLLALSIDQSFQVSIPIGQLMELTTIRQQAVLIRQQRRKETN